MRRSDRQVPDCYGQGIAKIDDGRPDATNDRFAAPVARKLGFFDAGIWLGTPAGYPLAEELKPERLRHALGRGFLRGGLVSHWRSATISAQEGNLALEAVLPNLPDETYVVWTGLPLYPAEPGPLPGQGKMPDKARRSENLSQDSQLSARRLDGRLSLRVDDRTPFAAVHLARRIGLAFPARWPSGFRN